MLLDHCAIRLQRQHLAQYICIEELTEGLCDPIKLLHAQVNPRINTSLALVPDIKTDLLFLC
jgi:hypothetical protein